MGATGTVAQIGGTAGLNSTALTIHGWQILGLHGFFMQGNVYDVGIVGLFLFQMVFMDTGATIPTGAMAERWKLSAFTVYGFFMAGFLYPVFACWAWGGGWLSQIGDKCHLGHGYIDFAGSGVVHTVGGLCGAAGAIVLGPRIGKYNSDGTANALPAHHLPMATLGALILAFGWFGFNPGSTLAASGGGNLRIGVIAFCTMVASGSAGLFAGLYTWIRNGKPDITMVINGLLAGLVAITAPSAFVSPAGAFYIGAVAGVLVVVAALFIDQKLRVDDPVGAVAVHAVNGLWGVISVGLFADGTFGDGWNNVDGKVTGLFYGGGASQLIAQLIGCLVLVVWAFGLSLVFFKIQDKIMGLRVSPESELEGLDLGECGMPAYHEIASSGTMGEGY
jgi:Amt family ammonium transporter